MISFVLAFCFFLLTAVTMRVWLKPPKPGSTEGTQTGYLLTATLLGALFFVACFCFGVWFSMLRLKGETWLL